MDRTTPDVTGRREMAQPGYGSADGASGYCAVSTIVPIPYELETTWGCR